MPRCAIIVRCYNEEEHIGRLLAGIMAQTIDDVDIVVVDSGSTDATVAIASRYPIKLVQIASEEFSFGRSLNLGCKAASGEILVMASAHVYPLYNDWLARLLAPFDDPGVGISYGKQRGAERTKYSEHKVFSKWFPDESSANQQHPFCNNANCAVRYSLWKELSYDESLTGLEDMEFAKRAMGRGARVSYAADAEVVHVHDETLRHICNRYRREAIAHRAIFPRQRFGLLDFARLFVRNTVSDCYHAGHDGVLLGNTWSILSFRLMQFWGTYRGFAREEPVTYQLKQKFYYPNALRKPRRAVEVEPSRRIDYTMITAAKDR